MKRNNEDEERRKKPRSYHCSTNCFENISVPTFRWKRAPIEPRHIETISWSSIPFQTFRISTSFLDERFIRARSLKRSFSFSLSLSLSLSFSLSRKKDRRSSRQMPVSAPIKFFDASPISFSNEIFVFSPLPLPFPCFEKGPHGNLYRSPGSCALKSRKESANRRGGGEGDRDRNGYFALSTSWPTVLFTTGSLSAKTMRLERSPRKEREREIAKERERER